MDLGVYGVSADGALSFEAEMSLGRTDRYTKAFHRVTVRALRDGVRFGRLAFYQLGADGYNKNPFGGVVLVMLAGAKRHQVAS